MSRIGNRILTIPAGVEVKIEPGNVVTVKGSKGELKQTFSTLIDIKVDGTELSTVRQNEDKHTKQLHGTTNSLLEGMLTGVCHPVAYQIPNGITVEVPKPTQIKISGIDKQLVGEVAANIRAYRRPEPYKGKGVKYKDEHIIRKEGKAAGK
jgi:large subunit ribosomal protein L6